MYKTETHLIGRTTLCIQGYKMYRTDSPHCEAHGTAILTCSTLSYYFQTNYPDKPFRVHPLPFNLHSSFLSPFQPYTVSSYTFQSSLQNMSHWRRLQFQTPPVGLLGYHPSNNLCSIFSYILSHVLLQMSWHPRLSSLPMAFLKFQFPFPPWMILPQITVQFCYYSTPTLTRIQCLPAQDLLLVQSTGNPSESPS